MCLALSTFLVLWKPILAVRAIWHQVIDRLEKTRMSLTTQTLQSIHDASLSVLLGSPWGVAAVQHLQAHPRGCGWGLLQCQAARPPPGCAFQASAAVEGLLGAEAQLTQQFSLSVHPRLRAMPPAGYPTPGAASLVLTRIPAAQFPCPCA